MANSVTAKRAISFGPIQPDAETAPIWSSKTPTMARTISFTAEDFKQALARISISSLGVTPAVLQGYVERAAEREAEEAARQAESNRRWQILRDRERSWSQYYGAQPGTRRWPQDY